MTTLLFANAILTLKGLYAFSVTSWIRSPKRNDYVGGVPKSYHLLGLAVDCVLDNPDDTVAFMSDCKRLHLQAIDEGDHIHVEPA